MIVQPENLGHGPAVFAGYRRALAHHPEFVLQVDGDGQFHGSDLRRVLVLLLDEAHAVSGRAPLPPGPVVSDGHDHGSFAGYVHLTFGVAARDPNCPLRGYDAGLLRGLLAALPQDCLIPNLYLTVVASRRGLALLEVDVSHRVRRGNSAQGTTWRGRTWSPIPLQLVRFSLAALQRIPSAAGSARLREPAASWRQRELGAPAAARVAARSRSGSDRRAGCAVRAGVVRCPWSLPAPG